MNRIPRAAAVLLLILASTGASASPPGTPAMPGTPVPGDGTLSYKSYLLHLPGKVSLTFYHDANGDSLTDILAVYGPRNAESPARNLAIFLQRPDGFAAEPDIRFRVPDDVALIDLGDVSPDYPGDELLFLTGDGVYWMPLAAQPDSGVAALRPLVQVRSIYAHANPLALEKRDFARTVGHDAGATLFIPVVNGYRVYYPSDHYASGQDLAIPHLHTVADNNYAVRISDMDLADVNGDGRPDFATWYLDELRVFFQEGGRFHDHPDLDINFGLITAEDRQSEAGLADRVGFQLKDLNGDSLADVFAWKRVVAKKAVINDKQQYQVYLNRNGRFNPVPDQAFLLKSLEGLPALEDLNGDGRPDLHTGTLDLSLPNLMKMLVTGRIDVALNFFLARPGGFPDEPDETRTFRIKFSLSNLDEFFIPAVEVNGDYDGDGVRDFLLQTADESVEVFRGRREGGLYERKASARLDTPASANDFVGDMNRDGRDDLAFDRFPDRKPFDPGWINVLLSTKIR